MECYGLAEIPSADFYCESCLAVDEAAASTKCILCFSRLGIMRRSTCGQWVHPICVLFTPELIVDDNMRACNLNHLNKIRNDLWCRMCRMQGGAVIQCSHVSCLCAFHPHCAFQSPHSSAMMVTRMSELDESISYLLFCEDHRSTLNMDGYVLISSTHPMNDSCSSSLAFEETPIGKRQLTVKRKR